MAEDRSAQEDQANRVFDLLCKHPDHIVTTSRAIAGRGGRIEELHEIGIPGAQGFVQAFAHRHSGTRRNTIRMIRKAEIGASEVIVDVVKRGLKDPNNRVRRAAVKTLMGLDVPDERKREEFIPLLVDLYSDPSKIVRSIMVKDWLFEAYAEDIPIDKLSEAVAREANPNLRLEMSGFLLKVHEICREGRLA